VELTAKGRYAVMAMADLAKHGAGAGSVPLSMIAERQQISLAYLEQIFALLRRDELVTSLRGRSGGYQLGRAAAKISIVDIMRAVDEGMRMIRCEGLGDGGGCVGDARCLTHELWTALGMRIAMFLSEVTLQDVLDGKPAAEICNGRGQGARPGSDAVATTASGR